MWENYDFQLYHRYNQILPQLSRFIIGTINVSEALMEFKEDKKEEF